MKDKNKTREQLLEELKTLRLRNDQLEALETQRKEAEEALREREERFRFMAENAGDVLYRLKYDSMSYDYLSPAIQRLTGYFPEEIQALRFSALVLKIEMLGQENISTEVLIQNRQEGKTGEYQADYLIRAKGGELRWLRDHSFPWLDESGRLIGSIGILTDVTERKHAEEQLKIYTAKLERSNRELQDFAFVASHDLQEPLRKIQLFGDRLKFKHRDFLNESGRDYIDRMQGAAKRMQTLIEALLDYSRVTTRAEPFESVPLIDLVQEVVTHLEARMEQTGGIVEVAPLPILEADPNQMHQLFLNLIGNALKFHKEEIPVVKVYARPMDDHPMENQLSEGLWYQLFVEDNGIGFDEKHVEQIFCPFHRLHGRSEYEGTGIGLATCRKIVERHGGNITARSQRGKGSTFIVTLPSRQFKRQNGTDL